MRTLSNLTSIATGLLALSLCPVLAAQTPVFINEIHYDNSGSDVNEAVEIAGPAGTDLTDWSLVLYNGNGGAVYNTLVLAGSLPDEGAGFGAASFAATGLQNGSPDGLALLDAGGGIVQFLSYEGSLTATDGPANGMTSTDIGVSEGGSGAIGDSLQLVGTGEEYEDFSWQAPAASSFGVINGEQIFDGSGGADVAPTVRSTSPADGDDEVAEEANIEITFSEAVTAAGIWFEIACDLSGAHSGTASSGDSTTYLIDPDTGFSVGDSCTVTVLAAQVADQDGSPDNMVENFSFSFDVPLPPQLEFIHAIQGPGASSPLEGEVVIIEAVVTGDFQDDDADEQSNLRGFYAQEEDADADADPATSEGIFVFDFTADPDVAVGDRVRVTGTVAEFFGETQISANLVEILASGSPLPTETDLTLPFDSVLLNADGEYIADLESVEGMLVNVQAMLRITELFNLDRFGELLLAEGDRIVQFTNDNAPDVAGLDAHRQFIARRTIMLDDGLTIQNPDPIRYPDPGLPNMVGASVRAGDNVVGVTGNIRFSRASGGSGDETYRLMPTAEPEFVADNLRPEAAPDVGGSLRVTSFNVLNYFTTLDGNGSICGPSGILGCRGADSQDEFDRQHAKLLTALLALDADVAGLVELENNGSASLQSIIDGLNAVAGAGSYAFIDTGTIGGDAIKVGFIYRPASVSPIGEFAVLDSSVDPLFIDTRNRPVLAQSFQGNASAGVFTATVSHLKSKGSPCTPEDPDAGDGQGNCNGIRTDAAVALVNWLATDPTGSNDLDFLILGDLNAYMREDPVVAIEDAGYINLLRTFIGEDAYSFLFDGQIGALDHALASPSLEQQVTGVAEWHINADEADATDYNLDFGRNPDIFDGDVPFRASDHDPVIVGLDLTSDLLICDANNNGIIGRDDVRLILRARGRPASGPNDPMDANGDGAITRSDVTICARRISRVRR